MSAKKTAPARATTRRSARAASPATRTAAAPRRATPKKPAARKPAPTKGPAGRLAAVKTPPRPAARRADFGAPVDGFIAKQPPERRALLDRLRKLVEAAAPDAEGALRWGMPTFTIGGRMMCAIGAHKAHVNLILAGRPETFVDPQGRLEGEGKTGRRLVLRQLSDLPEKPVRAWLEAAADNARRG